jgi:hypothetical protein
MAQTTGALGKKTRMALHAAQTGYLSQLPAGVSPIDYLLKVMRDPEKRDQRRLEAAKAAAPCIQPGLSSIDQTIRGGVSCIGELQAFAAIANPDTASRT